MSKENRTSWWDKIRYAHRHTDALDRFTGILVVLAVLVAGYDLYMRYRPIDLVNIETPVITDKKAYQVGETIYGVFNGEVKTDLQPVVSRNLICDHHSYSLSPRTATGGKRKLTNERVAIIILNKEQTLIPDQPIEPDTNCFIRFNNVYTIDLPISGKRTEQIKYFSDTFDIVE